MRLSIVSVSYQNRSDLSGFFDSLASQGVEHEVIVVDNGSTDGTVADLRARDGVTVIETGINAGYGFAMNRGLERARGEFVLLCNLDLEFRPGALAAMIEALAARDDLGGVSPVIENPEGGLYPLQRFDPGLYYGWSFFSGVMLKLPPTSRLNWHLDATPDRTAGDIPWIHGCCGLFRRAALERVGGLDERYFMYFEDADLGRALRGLGYHLAMAPHARVVHLEGQSSGGVDSPTASWFMDSWHLYLAKHRSLGARVVGQSLVTLALSVQSAVTVLHRLRGRRGVNHRLRRYWRSHRSALLGGLLGRRRRELEEVRRAFAQTSTGMSIVDPCAAPASDPLTMSS